MLYKFESKDVVDHLREGAAVNLKAERAAVCGNKNSSTVGSAVVGVVSELGVPQNDLAGVGRCISIVADSDGGAAIAGCQVVAVVAEDGVLNAKRQQGGGDQQACSREHMHAEE